MTKLAADPIDKEEGFLPQGPAASPRRLSLWGWLAVVLTIAAGTATYINSFRGVYVYDDLQSIRDNRHIRKLWPLPEAMSIPMADGGETVARRPILSLSFALNYAVSQKETWSYHLANLIIHLAAGLLLFGLVRRTLCLEQFRRHCGEKSIGIAFAVALTWTVHPLQTESVTYMVQRAESLMGMFYLLVMYASVRAFSSLRPAPWYALAIVACALGMGVKEVMFTAPLMAYLYDALFISRSYRVAWQRRWYFYIGLGATWSILFMMIVVVGGQGASEDFVDRSPLEYALTQPGVILYYIRLAVWPYPQAIDYNWPLAKTALAIGLPGTALLGLLAVTAWGLYRRSWYGFLGAWFFLILGPSSSFAALGQRLQEHRMYLSLAAVIVLLALVTDFVARKMFKGRAGPRVGVAVALCVAAVFSVLSVRRNMAYYSALDLWQKNVEVRPSSFVAYDGLGTEWSERKQPDVAVAYYRQAITVNPEFALARNNLGTVLVQQKKLPEAVEQLRIAIRLRPTYGQAYYNLALALYTQGKLEEATAHFRQALKYINNYWPAHFNLGNALFDQGQIDQAMFHWRRAIALGPDVVNARYRLGATLLRLGQPEEAAMHFREALKHTVNVVDSTQLHLSLGESLLALGDIDTALQHFRMAAAVEPENPDVYNWLGIALQRQGKLPEAAEQFREALNRAPDFAQAHVNLGSILTAQDELPEAIAHLNEAIKIAPEMAAAYNYLGVALAKRGEIPEAIEAFRQALQRAPNFADAHFDLADVLWEQKQHKEAIHHYLSGLEFEPDLGAIHLKLGQVYLEIDERESAVVHLRKAAQLLPKSQDVQQLLQDVLAGRGN